VGRATPFDAALGDVLDRLQEATTELGASGRPDEVADKAAALALRLTRSSQAVIALAGGGGGSGHVSVRTAEGVGALTEEEVTGLLAAQGRRAGSAMTVEVSAGQRVLGKIAVARAAAYTDRERQALEIFASQIAAALDAGGLVTRLWQTQDELRKTVDRLTKVDGARQMLLKNMTSVADRERKRFVTDLHDDAMQKLTAAELQLARLTPGKGIDHSILEDVLALLRQTESALRRLIFDVRPPALEGQNGLAQSLRDRMAMLAASGIQHELEVDIPEELSTDVRSTIFRQVAEAIGNAERHSRATLVKTSLTVQEGGVLGVVEDNGQGFVVAERSNIPGHLGLLALKERALMAGGRYKIESRPGAGTRIEFWVPLPG
jgi:signal transduction histidine kinase